MKTPDDGGPAFPHLPYRTDSRNWSDGSPGMDLRAYIATAALQGMNAGLSGTNEWPSEPAIKFMAVMAVTQADALITELNKASG